MVENTPVHSPAVLEWHEKEVEVPDTCGPFARQITENSPQMPCYVPAGGAGVYIRVLKIEVWQSYHKRQAPVCGQRLYVSRLPMFGT